ncbi:type IV secretory system conjugative DNA transfer family protein [Streptomyces lincolnensis]|uniref:type IV secretory system conjugative DNA transfer family protein n=1 Tax=Streptomyces lincolnensis TaxID=1915 RepID=UPI001E5F8E83|nr:type IV secretory system conjugative DNA transfer family protein [Streptomyces lincolnensis]MCD7441861.1 type IV secretory system conjugative DNA transfer family protein [Streptomyces lincolnensis]
MGSTEGVVHRCEVLQPLIVFGPQRSGKTTSVVIPAVLEWAGPSLVTSVRFDVIAATLEYRSSVGEVFIFDPAGLTESIGQRFAAHCVGWSPLDSITVWDDAVRQAESLSTGTDFRDVSNGDFWSSQGRLLLTPLLYAAARTGGTMGNVLDWLGMSASDLVYLIAERRRSLDDEPDSSGWRRCLSRLINYEEYSENTYGSICATAATTLEVFALEGVDRRCSQTRRLSLSTFLDCGRHTLFLCAPPHQQRQFMPLFTALARQVVSETIERNGVPSKDGQGIIEIPLMLCLDEAGNIARLDDLDTFATTAAGSGIQLISVFHDMSQLYATYGEDRGALIVNNHRGKLFLPGNSDTRTGIFLQEQLHTTAVRRHNRLGWDRSDLREMPPESALCLYGGMPPELIGLRRWDNDAILRRQVDEARARYRPPHRDETAPAPPVTAAEPVSVASYDELLELRDFVLTVIEQHDLGRSVLPCWYAHRGVVDELLALKDTWGTRSDVNWYYNLSTSSRRISILLRRCRASHVPAPSQRAGARDEHRIQIDRQLELLRPPPPPPPPLPLPPWADNDGSVW